MFAANSNGYGQQSISLMNNASTGHIDSVAEYVPTASDGSFDITGDYVCTQNQQVYLLALGGDPGAGVNPAAGLMAVLGNCPANNTFAGNLAYISINEVTTVAAAYAMSGYAVDALHVGSSGTPLALRGIANAFANATNLVDLASGTALSTTPNGNGAVPQAQINLLANIAAECINSTGPGSGPCSTLLGDATSDGTGAGTAPTDTATALINIAHNPGANVAALFALPSPAAPFAPAPPTQPNDFTLSLQFTGAALHVPTSLAFDASGNAWVTNQGTSTVSVLSNLGVPATGSPFSSNGVSAPAQVAIDSNGNAWIGNTGSSTISEFDAGGNAVSGSPFSLAGSDVSGALAVDATGNLWVASPTTSDVNMLASGGGSSLITGNGIASPFGVSIDPSGNAWIANLAADSVTILDHTGAPLANSPITGMGLDHPAAIAIDGAGNAWVANHGNSSLTVLDHTGSPVTGSPFSGGGLAVPVAVAFDGAGNVWVANANGAGVTELTSAGAAVAGSPFVAPSLSSPNFIAVDGAGSVWLTNTTGDSLTEIIGAATPAVTPIATALKNGSIGARP
jgi:streptogramin lyase